MSDTDAQRLLHESREDRMQRIEDEFTPRLILYCEDCQEMRRYTPGLTWHCTECGGGDLTTDQVKEDIENAC